MPNSISGPAGRNAAARRLCVAPRLISSFLRLTFQFFAENEALHVIFTRVGSAFGACNISYLYSLYVSSEHQLQNRFMQYSSSPIVPWWYWMRSAVILSYCCHTGYCQDHSRGENFKKSFGFTQRLVCQAERSFQQARRGANIIEKFPALQNCHYFCSWVWHTHTHINIRDGHLWFFSFITY